MAPIFNLILAYEPTTTPSTYLIGRKNTLPWPTLSNDLSIFQRLTTGSSLTKNCVVMGRKTYESLRDKTLTGRDLIILGKSYNNWNKIHERTGDVWICGGSLVYKKAILELPLKRIILTKVWNEKDLSGKTTLIDGDITMGKN